MFTTIFARRYLLTHITTSNIDNCDGYFLSLFLLVLSTSASYRWQLFNAIGPRNLAKPGEKEKKVMLHVKQRSRDSIDYRWNDILNYLVFEKQELDHAMSWLSTLGGAFSALGDHFDRCAKVAGKISVEQFKIAMRLGEPPLVARCKIYMALSLIQQGFLKAAQRVIEDQYQIGKQYKDTRLQNMCKGVWSKLQYVTKIRKSG